MALVEQAARGEPPEVVAELGVLVPDSHAARLLGWIECLLGLVGWPKRTLDAFVAVRGPGSFTGIRVGLGTVRGLALASGRPCFGVTRLEATAEAYGAAPAARVPLLPAGRGEYYGARYDADGSPPRQLHEPWLGAIEQRLVDEPDGAVLIVPEELQHEPTLRELATARFSIGRAPSIIAGAAGRLALLGCESRCEESYPPTPLYLRPPDAELKTARR